MSGTKRTTVYLDEDHHRAVRLRAAETNTRMSAVIGLAVRNLLAEDMEDLRALRERRGEPVRPFEDFLEELTDEGVI